MALIQLIAAATAIGGLQTQTPVPPFPDVPKDHWAFPAVESLRVKGIVRGYPDGNFRGKRTITRNEGAAGLNSALQSFLNVPSDAHWNNLIGPRGPKGERGPQGPAGPAGARPEVVDELIRILQNARPALDRIH